MQSQNQMHGGSGSNHPNNTNGKRSLDSLAVPDELSPPQKRPNSDQMPVLSDADAAVERELAALVSQLNSQDQTGSSADLGHPSLGGDDDHASAALLLEQQLEGALATINAAHLELPPQAEQSNSLMGDPKTGADTTGQTPALPVQEPAPEAAAAAESEPVPVPEPPRQSENYLDELQKQILEAVADSERTAQSEQQQQQQQQPQPEQEAASTTAGATAAVQPESERESPADVTLLGNDPVVRQARKHSAGALNLVSAQVLTLLSQGYYQEVLNLVTQPDSERGKVYYTLIDALENLKRLYLPKTGAFIPAEVPDLPEFKELSTITHRANLATFCAACFGTIEIGFKELNDKVFEILVPHGTRRILKSHIPVILNLKTQAYIASFDSTDKPREEILNELFPSDISEQLSAMHPDRPDLSPSETDYVNRSLRRRENLVKEESQEALAKEYQWVYFLRELSEYIMKGHDLKSIFEAPMPAGAAETGTEEAADAGSSEATTQAEKNRTASSETTAGTSRSATSAPKPRATPKKPRKKAKTATAAAAAATAATAASESDAQSKEGEKEEGNEAKDGKAEENDSADKDKDKSTKSSDDSLRVYEAARSKASSEGIDVVRQIKTANLTRRSWTKEEEEALMKGLDRVQGPYWAQILELYGLGGSISEVLKDRNQVQLKDKARNLKMLMVRLGLPLPAVFEYVTGDWEARRGRGRRAKDRENAARQKRPVEELESELKAEAANLSTQTDQPGNADAEIDAAVAQIQEAKARKSRPAAGAKNAHLPQDQQPQLLSMDPHMQPDQLHLHQLHQPQDHHHHHHQLGDQSATEDAAQAVERALGLLQQQDNEDTANQDERQIQHLLQSVGEYING